VSDGFSLKTLLDDLHKLEINTIEKQNLTAEKMPAPLLAIRQIITDYEIFCGSGAMARDNKSRLEYLKKHAEAKITSDAIPTSRKLIYARIRTSSLTLLGILDRAQHERERDREARGGHVNDPQVQAPDGTVGDILRSVQTEPDKKTKKLEAERRRTGKTGPIPDPLYHASSDVLLKMDRTFINNAWPVSAADRAQIRKIWEIGTEHVLVQTVIQIEGDVITRINPQVQHNEKRYLLDVHQRGIETSLKMWRELVSVAEGLVRAVTKAIVS